MGRRRGRQWRSSVHVATAACKAAAAGKNEEAVRVGQEVEGRKGRQTWGYAGRLSVCTQMALHRAECPGSPARYGNLSCVRVSSQEEGRCVFSSEGSMRRGTVCSMGQTGM